MNIFTRTIKILALTTFGILSIPAAADNGDWTIYGSYHNPTKAVKVDTYYYVLANGNLYVYDTEDTSVGTFDKTNALSDCKIYDIAYCKSTNSLFILYDNLNIDIMRIGKQCVNMPELKNKSLNNKEIYDINITGDKAYISTGSGIVVVNTKDFYFENLYNIATDLTKTLVSDTKIYAITKNGVYVGNFSDNLLDASYWKFMQESELANDTEYNSLKNENVSDEEGLKLAKSIEINSPIRNYSYKLNMVGNRLLVAGGNFYYDEIVNYPGTLMKYENDKWTNFDETIPIEKYSSKYYMNLTDIIQDPKDSEHHWASSARSGLYEFRDYKMVNNYSNNNSPLNSILPENSNANLFVRITGLQYDNDGNLWMCNNECDTIVRILKNDGSWVAYYYDQIKNFQTFDNIRFDSRGWAWINCRRTTSGGNVAGILVINTNGTIDDQEDDDVKYITTFKNQDGTSYTPNLYYCAEQDLDGAIWIGNEDGLFVTYDPSTVFDSNFYLSQVKISRNDGTNLADYLLSKVPVKCIAIDGGNRKWVGTTANGVYLISADGQEIIEHFTTSNSPLLSDGINDIKINGETGEVYFATRSGLCSYRGDATDASENMDNSSLKVYPNPVRPEYTGEVHITGLMFNSNVKIVNAAGKLVYEGTSIGGEFSWNCCYKSGKRCGSGIYYALCTDEEGNKGAAAKILVIK